MKSAGYTPSIGELLGSGTALVMHGTALVTGGA